MGGCPFIPGAAGNIATEDVVNLFDAMGLSPGVNIPQVAHWSRMLEELCGRVFPGKMHRITRPATDKPNA